MSEPEKADSEEAKRAQNLAKVAALMRYAPDLFDKQMRAAGRSGPFDCFQTGGIFCAWKTVGFPPGQPSRVSTAPPWPRHSPALCGQVSPASGSAWAACVATQCQCRLLPWR